MGNKTALLTHILEVSSVLILFNLPVLIFLGFKTYQLSVFCAVYLDCVLWDSHQMFSLKFPHWHSF